MGSTDRRDGSPRRSPRSHTAARQGPHSPLGCPSPKSPPLHVPWEWGWETWTLTMKLAGLLGPQIRGQSSCEAVSFPSLPQGVNTTAGEGTGQVPHPPAPVPPHPQIHQWMLRRGHLRVSQQDQAMSSRETQRRGLRCLHSCHSCPEHWTQFHDGQEVPAERGLSQFSSTTRTHQLPPPSFQPLSLSIWD